MSIDRLDCAMKELACHYAKLRANESTYEHSKFMVDKFSQMPYFEQFKEMCTIEYKRLQSEKMQSLSK